MPKRKDAFAKTFDAPRMWISTLVLSKSASFETGTAKHDPKFIDAAKRLFAMSRATASFASGRSSAKMSAMICGSKCVISASTLGSTPSFAPFRTMSTVAEVMESTAASIFAERTSRLCERVTLGPNFSNTCAESRRLAGIFSTPIFAVSTKPGADATSWPRGCWEMLNHSYFICNCPCTFPCVEDGMWLLLYLMCLNSWRGFWDSAKASGMDNGKRTPSESSEVIQSSSRTSTTTFCERSYTAKSW
mmetsp:Transcript_34443/g.97871  ORF Transcript_34443/g.97871 Transcript_34443/m.97871 type:complete len:247 (+) Transcript_34443:210-950(+)